MPHKISLKNIWNIQYIRFAGGGVLNLTAKIVLTSFFGIFQLRLWVNYALVQCIILFFSYTYHTLVTFKKKPTLKTFFTFTGSVLLLKLSDYFLVVMTNRIEPLKQWIPQIPVVGPFLTEHFLPLSIVFSTVIVFIIRYLLFRKVFTQTTGPQSLKNEHT